MKNSHSDIADIATLQPTARQLTHRGLDNENSPSGEMGMRWKKSQVQIPIRLTLGTDGVLQIEHTPALLSECNSVLLPQLQNDTPASTGAPTDESDPAEIKPQLT